MHNFVAIALLIFTSSAVAQTPPKSIKTLRVQTTFSPLYVVETSGTVRVDWRRVETTARSAELADSNMARALIAVRDGKAQTMP